ncbi:MAG: hypothetical protein K2O49_05065, partial [Muribaculaceae bacterium]|nr:hypothetical protein [Muribaculaceae bacterium]
MRNHSFLKIITLAMMWLAATGIANAIPTTAEVTLDGQSGSEVTLISAANAPKAKEAEELAVKQAFFGLINRGVEGLHSGQPMLTTPSKEFDYTFYKEAKYRNYLTSTPVRLDETKIGSDRRVRMKVTVNIEKLKNDLLASHLSVSPAWQDKGKTGPPTG